MFSKCSQTESGIQEELNLDPCFPSLTETFPDEHVNELRESLEICFATARKTLQAELKRTKRDLI